MSCYHILKHNWEWSIFSERVTYVKSLSHVCSWLHSEQTVTSSYMPLRLGGLHPPQHQVWEGRRPRGSAETAEQQVLLYFLPTSWGQSGSRADSRFLSHEQNCISTAILQPFFRVHATLEGLYNFHIINGIIIALMNSRTLKIDSTHTPLLRMV